MKNVCMLSGGRTSAVMLRLLLDTLPHYRETWTTFFANTGKERPETLDFVREIGERWGVPIVWGEYRRVAASSIPAGIYPDKIRNRNLAQAAANGEKAHWFQIVNYETASRNGEPFDAVCEWTPGLPNPVGRACSTQMKFRTCARYLFSQGIAEYAPAIGIRSDEAHRKVSILATCDGYEHPTFPLVEFGFNESDVTAFWKAQTFDLKLKSYEGNCDLCFLKSLPKRVRIAKERPDLVKWWADWETRKQSTARTALGAQFKKGQPFTRIVALAKDEAARDKMTNDEKQDLPCSCVERGMEADDSV